MDSGFSKRVVRSFGREKRLFNEQHQDNGVQMEKNEVGSLILVITKANENDK